jgi:protein-disulfide isomerase
VADLGSAPLPPLQPDDHVRGDERAPLIVEYADFQCHYCALTHIRLLPLRVRQVFRHFPVRSKHPRAWACGCAAEAAGLQGRFWGFHDALYADQGRLEDPHLWRHARELGLDLERFEHDRRSDAVAARVRRDFQAGVRAGVASTPTLFFDGVAHAGWTGKVSALLERIAG